MYASVFISYKRDWHLGLDLSVKLPEDNAAREALVKPVADHSIFSESMVAFRPEAPPVLDMNVVVAVAAADLDFNRWGWMLTDFDRFSFLFWGGKGELAEHPKCRKESPRKGIYEGLRAPVPPL